MLRANAPIEPAATTRVSAFDIEATVCFDDAKNCPFAPLMPAHVRERIYIALLGQNTAKPGHTNGRRTRVALLQTSIENVDTAGSSAQIRRTQKLFFALQYRSDRVAAEFAQLHPAGDRKIADLAR